MQITKRRAGFTLIELLVVVVIIGILASVGFANFAAAQDKARNASVISNTRSVFLGIENWKTDYTGMLPVDLVGTADPSLYLAAAGDGDASAFPSKYVPGAMLPKSPWADKPQVAMDGSLYNNASLQGFSAVGGRIKSGEPLPINNSYFQDSYSDGGKVPAAGTGPSERGHYGYIYYCGEVNSSRYAVFGVGKHKKEARVFAVKSNY